MDPRVAGRVTKDTDCLGAGREGRARGGAAPEMTGLMLIPELPILDRLSDDILISATCLSASSSIGRLQDHTQSNMKDRDKVPDRK